jgi:membrane protease YdiL (CAAX protease family)
MNDASTPISRRALTIMVLVALVFPTLVTWVYFIWLKDSPAGLQQSAYSMGKAIQFTLPIVWVLLVERRRPRWSRPALRGVLESVGFGLLILAVMLLVWNYWLQPGGYLDAASGEIRKKVLGIGLDTPQKYFAVGLFYSLGHSLLEEYYWRWFVFRELQKLLPLSVAIVLSSLGFMAHHVLVLGMYFGTFSFATLFLSLSTAVGGAIWAWLYYRSGSLVGPWLSHMLVDAGIFIIGYDIVGQVLK